MSGRDTPGATREPAGVDDIDALRESVRADAREAFDDLDRPFAGAPGESFLESYMRFDHLEPYDLEEAYWVNEPYAHVAVVRDPDTDQRRYLFTEPTLDATERFVREDLSTVIREELVDERVADVADAAFERRVADALAEHGAHLSDGTLHKLHYYFRRDFVGYGAIDAMMRDPAVEDVSCNGNEVPVYVYHSRHGNLETDLAFDEERLDAMVVKLAQRCGRHVSASLPLLTDTLPDGSRVQLTLGSDVGARGSNFTVRLFSEVPFTPVDLVDLETFSISTMTYLWLAVEYNKSVLFVGPTASGKTTSMNAVSLFIPPDHKVVSIEETREVGLPHDNWIADVTRESALGAGRTEIGMYHLLSEALHQRPDHIIVGEIRTNPDVVRTFFQAMGTGHAGFSTFHADSPEDTLRRLRHDPLAVPNELLTDLDVISVQRQVDLDGERARRCSRLVEVGGDIAAETPTLRTVFDHDPREDVIEQVDASGLLGDIADEEGWSDDRLATEVRRRARMLAGLLAEGADYERVTAALFRFARAPDRALESVPAPERPLPTLEVTDAG